MESVIIFGAGNTGKRVFKENLDRFKVLFFLDNDKEKWGTQLEGIPVMQPSKTNLERYSFDYILIASVFGRQQIELQLTECGVEVEKILGIERKPDVLSPFLKNLSDMYQNENVSGSVAEVGVFQGESAEIINRHFPNRNLYLFDTFTGFEEEDIKIEKEHLFSNSKVNQYSDTSVEIVMQRMIYPERIIIHKGYFPDSAAGLTDRFCFVRIDMDLYSPTVEALDFFYPLMSQNGCILVHDYFGESYKGIKKAVDMYLKEHAELSKIPIGDTLSIAIVGYNRRENG